MLQPKSIQEVEQIARLAGDTKPLSGITQRDIFSRLSTCLRFAVHRRYIEFNPCETVTRPSVGAVPKKAAPRSETIGRLLRQIESERWGAAIVIAVTAGLRKGEVLALRWEDIEWKAAFPDFGEVTIGRQVQRLGRGIGLLVRDIVRTDASDAVRPLPPATLAALERRRKEQSAEILRAPKAQAGDKAEDDKYHWRGDDIRPGKAGFIFTSDVGTVVDPRNFDRWFRAQCTKARMPKGYTFHRLRHDYASILLKQGVKDRVAQEMLRHANYSTTANIYQHASSDEHFAAAQAVQAWIERALS